MAISNRNGALGAAVRGALAVVACLQLNCADLKEAGILGGMITQEFGVAALVSVGVTSEASGGRSTHQRLLTVTFEDSRLQTMPETALRDFAANVASFARVHYQGTHPLDVIIIESTQQRNLGLANIEKTRRFVFAQEDSTSWQGSPEALGEGGESVRLDH